MSVIFLLDDCFLLAIREVQAIVFRSSGLKRKAKESDLSRKLDALSLFRRAWSGSERNVLAAEKNRP